MRIAFGHKSRVGKDELCNYLQSKFGGDIIRIAEPLYTLSHKVQEYYGDEIKKDPKLLQFLGMNVREICGDDVWINSALLRVKEECPYQTDDNNYYIPDLRFKNEFRLLKERGFITIKINRPDRPIDRDPNHPSEIELDDAEFDYVIDNDSTLESLKRKLDYIIATELRLIPLYCSFKFEIDGHKYAIIEKWSESKIKSRGLMCAYCIMTQQEYSDSQEFAEKYWNEFLNIYINQNELECDEKYKKIFNSFEISYS